MGPFKLRGAKVEDLGAIAEIHKRSLQTFYRGIAPDGFLDQLNTERMRQNWRSNLERFPRNLTVAEASNGEILGFCCAGPVVDQDRNAPYEFEVYGLHVRSESQRCGVGRALMNDSFVRAKTIERAGSAIVWTLVDLVRSRAFYDGLGGHVVKHGIWRLGCFEIPEVAYGWSSL